MTLTPKLRVVTEGRQLYMLGMYKHWRKSILVLIIAVALTLGTLYWLTTSSGEIVTPAIGNAKQPTELGTPADEAARIVEAPGSAERQAKTPPPVLALLPSSDLPLAEQIDDLVTLAETGDPTASCRLIIGANRCIEHARNAKFTERVIRSLEQQPGRHEGLGINLAAISKENEAKSSGYCAGVDMGSLPRAENVLANSYQFLSPRQKTILALMRSDGVIRRLEREPDLSEMALYVYPQVLADNAYAFLQSGIQAHDPLALEGMLLVHSPGLSLGPRGAGLWLPNPRLFLKYSFMLARLFGEQALGRAANMVHSTMLVTDPVELEKIRREADFESEQWIRASGSTPIARPQPDDNLGDC